MSDDELLAQLLELEPIDSATAESELPTIARRHQDVVPALCVAADILKTHAPNNLTTFLVKLRNSSAGSPYVGALALLVAAQTNWFQSAISYHALARALHNGRRNADQSIPLMEVARLCYLRSRAPQLGYHRGRLLMAYADALYPSDWQQAVAFADEGIALLKHASPYERMVALSIRSGIYHHARQYEESIADGECCLGIFQTIAEPDEGEREFAAVMQAEMGEAYFLGRADIDKAQACFDSARPLVMLSADWAVRASLALMEAIVRLDTGDFYSASRLLQQAIESYDKADNAHDRAKAVQTRARLQEALGEFDDAARLYKAAQAALIEADDPNAVAETLVYRAQLPADIEPDPLSLLEEAERRFAGQNNQHALAWIRLEEARAILRSPSGRLPEQLKRAAMLLDAAEQGFRDLGSPHLALLCRAVRLLGSPDPEPEALQDCLTLMRAISDPLTRLALHQALGEAFERRGQIAAARQAYDAAISELRTTRQRIRQGVQVANFFRTRRRPYERAIALAAAQNQSELVWRYAEEPRAPALLDQLTKTAGSEPIRADDPLWQEVARVRAQLQLRYSAPSATARTGTLRHTRSQAAAGHNDDDIRDLEARLNELLEALERSGDDRLSWESGEIASIAAVRQALGPDAALVEYLLVGGAGTSAREIWALVLTPDNLHIVRPLADTRARIKLRSKLGDRMLAWVDDDPLPALREIYRCLVAPLTALLSPYRQLVIALPDDEPALQLPIHAAFDGQHFLIEQHTISYTPSGTIFARCQQKPAPPISNALIAGYGGRDLAAVQAEVEQVAACFPLAQAHYGPLRAADLLDALQQADLIHLSCHGSAGRSDARFALLVIGPDEYLLARDCFGARLRADLVTLSACESGREVQATLGLVGGMLAAGARSVLASLWAVSDSLSCDLMADFYQRLAANSALGRAEALCAIQRSMLHNPLTADPRLWAPFFLTGAIDPLQIPLHS